MFPPISELQAGQCRPVRHVLVVSCLKRQAHYPSASKPICSPFHTTRRSAVIPAQVRGSFTGWIASGRQIPESHEQEEEGKRGHDAERRYVGCKRRDSEHAEIQAEDERHRSVDMERASSTMPCISWAFFVLSCLTVRGAREPQTQQSSTGGRIEKMPLAQYRVRLL